MTALTRLAPLLAVAAVVALGTACSSPSPTSGSATASAGTPSAPVAAGESVGPTAGSAPAVAVIKDFGYTVPPSVAAGATLTVQNKDSVAHTVTLGGGAASKVVVQGGGAGTLVVPTRPGRYPITCDYHGNMHSVLVVA